MLKVASTLCFAMYLYVCIIPPYSHLFEFMQKGTGHYLFATKCVSQKVLSLYDNLSRPLEFTTIDKNIRSDKCNYVTPLDCDNLNPDDYNFVVLQLNIQSLLSHQSDLRRLLQILKNKNSKVDAVLLCETFLTKFTNNLVNIPGYTLINNNQLQSKGGQVAILFRDDIPHKKGQTSIS